MSDCIFCKIINNEIPCSKVYENDYILAFNDINPQAPIHVLIVPKVHISNLNEVNEENSKYVLEILNSIKEVAKICNAFEKGYRVISNCGKDAGQTVDHLHFHLLAGTNLSEKMISGRGQQLLLA